MRRILLSVILFLALLLYTALRVAAQNVPVNKVGISVLLPSIPDNGTTAKNLLPLSDLNRISTASMQVFPNPVKGPLVTIQIETEQPGLHMVKLYNEFGKLLKSINVTLVRGSQSVLFELGELSPGYYSVQLTGGFSKAMTLLVK